MLSAGYRYHHGGSADLLVIEGNVPTIEVTADSHLQQHITTEVEGNTLRTEQRCSINGLHAEISGAGDVDLAGDAQGLTVSVSGAGVVTAHGTVAEGSLTVSEAGGIVGEDLTIADCVRGPRGPRRERVRGWQRDLLGKPHSHQGRLRRRIDLARIKRGCYDAGVGEGVG